MGGGRRVLVIGHRASATVAALRGVAGSNWVFDDGLTDTRVSMDVDALFCRVEPTHVFHAPRAPPGGTFDDWLDNARSTANVLDACRRYGVRKTVTALAGFPEVAERACRLLCRETGRPYVTVSLGDEVFGPGDEDGDVATMIREACSQPQLRVVPGTSKQLMFARDAAALLVRAMDEYDSPEPLFADPPFVRIETLAREVAALAGCELGCDDARDDAAARRALRPGLEVTMAWHLARRGGA